MSRTDKDIPYHIAYENITKTPKQEVKKITVAFRDLLNYSCFGMTDFLQNDESWNDKKLMMYTPFSDNDDCHPEKIVRYRIPYTPHMFAHEVHLYRSDLYTPDCLPRRGKEIDNGEYLQGYKPELKGYGFVHPYSHSVIDLWTDKYELRLPDEIYSDDGDKIIMGNLDRYSSRFHRAGDFLWKYKKNLFYDSPTIVLVGCDIENVTLEKITTHYTDSASDRYELGRYARYKTGKKDAYPRRQSRSDHKMQLNDITKAINGSGCFDDIDQLDDFVDVEDYYVYKNIMNS